MLKAFLSLLLTLLILHPAHAQDTLQPITSANAAQLQQIAQLGDGALAETGWSPDGKYFFVITQANLALYDTADFTQPPRLLPGVTRLSRFSPDASHAVILDSQARFQLLDLASGSTVDLLSTPRDRQVYTMEPSFSADSQRLLMNSFDENYDHYAVVWDVATGQELERWAPARMVYLEDGYRLSPGGNWFIATEPYLGTSVLHHVNTPPDEEVHLEEAQALAFNSDDSLLAWVGNAPARAGQEVRLRDMATMQETPIQYLPGYNISQLLFTPDGHHLIIYASDFKLAGFLTVWDLQKQAERATSKFTTSVTLHFTGLTPDGRYLLQDSLGEPSLWDLQTAQPVETPWSGAVTYTPNGRYALSTSALWSADFASDDQPLLNFDGTFSSLSPDSRWVAAQSGDALNIYDLSQPTLPTAPSFTLNHPAYDRASFSPDNRLLLTVTGGVAQLRDSLTLDPLAPVAGLAGKPTFALDADGHLSLAGAYTLPDQPPQIAVWQIGAGSPLTVSAPRLFENNYVQPFAFNPLALSPGAGYLAAALGDETRHDQVIELWNLNRDTQPLLVEGHREPINALVFNADGTRFATGSGFTSPDHFADDYTARIWRITPATSPGTSTTVTEVTRFQSASQVDNLAFSPDGRLLAVRALGGSIRVWNTRNGALVTEKLQEFQHRDHAPSLAFNPDGTLLAAADEHGAIHLWDTQSWVEVGVLYGHYGTVETLQFRADGQVLLSGADGLLRFWGVPT